MSNDFLWVEKYRPRAVSETILREDLKKVFQEIVKGGELPNMIFSGGPGMGKTTVAKALCNELDVDYLMINASKEGNIDTLRNRIAHFASTVSLSGGYKVVILDEADYLNQQSTQPALRGFIEEFSSNCRFILTCNFKNRIIEPLHSRCSVYDFNITKKDMPPLAAAFSKRMMEILAAEKIEFDKKVIFELVSKHMPDWRRVIGECQRYSLSGRIDAGVLVNLTDESYGSLVKALKNKDFKTMRQWVADNIDNDASTIFRKVYDTMNTHMDPQSIPQAVITLADYQYKAAFVADQELNVVACFTELMADVNFK